MAISNLSTPTISKNFPLQWLAWLFSSDAFSCGFDLFITSKAIGLGRLPFFPNEACGIKFGARLNRRFQSSAAHSSEMKRVAINYISNYFLFLIINIVRIPIIYTNLFRIDAYIQRLYFWSFCVEIHFSYFYCIFAFVMWFDNAWNRGGGDDYLRAARCGYHDLTRSSLREVSLHAYDQA
ncbi:MULTISPECIES: hypothetical protein [Agrobacterium]|uniref:hypothetical protein n=1 Tax=Agrobacterium TaxID=357 RepID=UPI0015861197|nr:MULTISPECIES: hypothetical protein [Agrobacterium]